MVQIAAKMPKLYSKCRDGLDKVEHDYMRWLNRQHELIIGRCFGELIWRSSEEITAASVEPTL
jgi:hypothetical protein